MRRRSRGVLGVIDRSRSSSCYAILSAVRVERRQHVICIRLIQSMEVDVLSSSTTFSDLYLQIAVRQFASAQLLGVESQGIARSPRRQSESCTSSVLARPVEMHKLQPSWSHPAHSSSSTTSRDTSPDTLNSKHRKRGPEGKSNGRKKVAKACLACQRSHLTCDERKSPVYISFSIAIKQPDGKLTTRNWTGRPCARCLKKGVGERCVEGKRKKAKYLLEGEERSESLLLSLEKSGLRLETHRLFKPSQQRFA